MMVRRIELQDSQAANTTAEGASRTMELLRQLYFSQ
jgi:hypothetical protein